MALKGTIKDFGVADIFQLISQQAKTGVLVLSNDVDAVRVYFKDGSVVRAENTTRPAQMLLGNFMVRAAVLTQEKLDQALKDGYSTGGGLGLGLSGARRLSNEFSVDSAPGRGTRVVITRWK